MHNIHRQRCFWAVVGITLGSVPLQINTPMRTCKYRTLLRSTGFWMSLRCLPFFRQNLTQSSVVVSLLKIQLSCGVSARLLQHNAGDDLLCTRSLSFFRAFQF
jgi:hypothetical protein